LQIPRNRARILAGGVDDEIRPELKGSLQLLLMPGDPDDGIGAERLGHLPHILTDASRDPNDNNVVTGLQPCSLGSLVGSRRGIGNHGQMRERSVSPVLHLAEVDTRHRNMARKAAVQSQAVPRHLLIQASISSPGFAKDALPAGHYSRNDDFLSQPRRITGHHRSGYLVPQG
jgi:hypothetical protein